MDFDLKVNSDVSQRLLVFMNSSLFVIRSSNAKTEYWKYYADKMLTTINQKLVHVKGESGFCIPWKSSGLLSIARNAYLSFLNFLEDVNWVIRKLLRRINIPYLITYEKAFDAVMSGAVILS